MEPLRKELLVQNGFFTPPVVPYRGRLGTVLHFAHCVYSQSSSVASLVSATYPSAKQVLIRPSSRKNGPTQDGVGPF